jgi:hypothetical protein
MAATDKKTKKVEKKRERKEDQKEEKNEEVIEVSSPPSDVNVFNYSKCNRTTCMGCGRSAKMNTLVIEHFPKGVPPHQFYHVECFRWYPLTKDEINITFTNWDDLPPEDQETVIKAFDSPPPKPQNTPDFLSFTTPELRAYVKNMGISMDKSATRHQLLKWCHSEISMSDDEKSNIPPLKKHKRVNDKKINKATACSLTPEQRIKVREIMSRPPSLANYTAASAIYFSCSCDHCTLGYLGTHTMRHFYEQDTF